MSEVFFSFPSLLAAVLALNEDQYQSKILKLYLVCIHFLSSVSSFQCAEIVVFSPTGWYSSSIFYSVTIIIIAHGTTMWISIGLPVVWDLLGNVILTVSPAVFAVFPVVLWRLSFQPSGRCLLLSRLARSPSSCRHLFHRLRSIVLEDWDYGQKKKNWLTSK